MTLLKELLILHITLLLVLLPSLRNLLLVMFYVIISVKRIIEVLDICCLLGLVSEPHLPP